ncbi:MAG: hypothetical protein PHG80_10945 [Methanoregulaceae archaeon]|nr:hypothetical protein [Methanoregulaceae archaeon]
MAENVFGVLGEIMVVTQYIGIFLLIGVILVFSLIVWRGALVKTRIIGAVACFIIAMLLFIYLQGSVGGG